MSDVMGWFRRRFRFLGGVAGAVSHADTGPYAGAPRDPELRIGDEKSYSTIRHQASHTTISTSADAGRCPRCGRPSTEAHELGQAGGSDPVGTVHICQRCRADSWLVESRMPAVRRARDKHRKHVV